MNNSKSLRGTKRLFLRLGTCSQLLCHILNREFGHPMKAEEHAADPLAGGMVQRGQQCGMLWGSTLAVGAESLRRHADRGQASAAAMTATQHLVESFTKRTNSVNCRDITGCDWSSRSSMLKYMLTGRFLYCFRLAEKWAPEAIQAATKGLSRAQADLPQPATSCASLVAQEMGASDAEMALVAGFAGGIGLSGNACGALGAAIWMNTLARNRQEGYNKAAMFNPRAEEIVQAFCAATDSEMLCHKICGRRFETIEDHTEFINDGGCDKLINVLARS